MLRKPSISPGGVKMVIDTDAADQFAVGTEFITSLAPIWGDAKITCTVARICEDGLHHWCSI